MFSGQDVNRLLEGFGFDTELDPDNEHDQWIEAAASVLATVDERPDAPQVLAPVSKAVLKGHERSDFENAVVIARESSFAEVGGDSQCFFSDNSKGKIAGSAVYAFLDNHAGIESNGCHVICAGGASVSASGGWVGVKDDGVAHVCDGRVQATGNGIAVVQGRSMVVAEGTSVVLVSDSAVTVKVCSKGARIIFASDEARAARIEGKFRPGQIHEAYSPALLDLWNELNFRELVRQLPVDSGVAQESRQAARRRIAAETERNLDEEATDIACELIAVSSSEQALQLIGRLRTLELQVGCRLAGRYLKRLKSGFDSQYNSLEEAVGLQSSADGGLSKQAINVFKECIKDALKHDLHLQAALAAARYGSARSGSEAAECYLHLTVLCKENKFAKKHLEETIGQAIIGKTRRPPGSASESADSADRPGGAVSLGLALRTAITHDLQFLPREVRDSQRRAEASAGPAMDILARAAVENFAKTRSAARALESLCDLELQWQLGSASAAPHIKNLSQQGDSGRQQEVLDQLKSQLESCQGKLLPAEIKAAQLALKRTSLMSADERVIDLGRRLRQAERQEDVTDLLFELEEAARTSNAARDLLRELDKSWSRQSRKSPSQGMRPQIGAPTGMRLDQVIRLNSRFQAMHPAWQVLNAQNAEDFAHELDKLWLLSEAENSEAVTYLESLQLTDRPELDRLQRTILDPQNGNSEFEQALQLAQERLHPLVDREQKELATTVARLIVNAESLEDGFSAMQTLAELAAFNPYAAQYQALIQPMLEKSLPAVLSDLDTGSEHGSGH